MAAQWEKLGIIAGGGSLPVEVAQACLDRDKPFFVIRLDGHADDGTLIFPHATHGIGALGTTIKRLKAEGCDAITFAGLVRRPDFSKVRPDLRGAALLPKVIMAARRGDGAILETMIGAFEVEGFAVLGAEEVTGQIHVPAGVVGKLSPQAEHFADMRKASAIVDALDGFDVGQGAVVREGFVVAVEAAEGTDDMLRRCAVIAARLGARREKKGVLLKKPKPTQEMRVDLPTIGPRTIALAEEAGLAGIAIMADASIILDRAEVVRAADGAGLFIYAFTAEELDAPVETGAA